MVTLAKWSCIPCSSVIKGVLKYNFFSSAAASSDLAKQKKRLEDANKKKQSLKEDLQKAEDELRGIQRGSVGYVTLTQQFCSHY